MQTPSGIYCMSLARLSVQLRRKSEWEKLRLRWASPRILAAPGRDDLRQDRDCNLVGSDGAEVEASRRFELGQSFGRNSLLRQRRLQHFGLATAADKSE